MTIAKQQRNINLNSQIDKKNEILETQDKLIDVKIQKMAKAKETARTMDISFFIRSTELQAIYSSL